MDITKTVNFQAIWLKGRVGDKDIDMIIDTGASAHNVIPLKIAKEIGIEPQFNGKKVTTIGNEEVNISAPIKLTFKLNGFEQNLDFVIIDTDVDFCILGMPFVDRLTSVNMRSKTIYAGKARIPFTSNRNDINHMIK